MKSYFFLVLLSTTFLSFGQVFNYSNAVIRNYNEDYLKDGTWIFYDSLENNLESVATFSKDSLIEVLYRMEFGNHSDYIYKQYNCGRLWNLQYIFDGCIQLPYGGTFYNGNGLLHEFYPQSDTSCRVLFSSKKYINGVPNGHASYFYLDGYKLKCEGVLLPVDTINPCYKDILVTSSNDTIEDYYFKNDIGLKVGWWKYYTYSGFLAFEAYYYENGEIKEIIDYQTKKSKLSGNELTYYKKKCKAAIVTDDFGLAHFKDVIEYW